MRDFLGLRGSLALELAARRLHFRLGLSELYTPYYDALCANLESHWQPYCGLRSFELQDELYERRDGTTRAKGGESPHNYGCASDWCPWKDGRPVWDKKDSVWREYENACEKVGVKWLGPSGDYPHNELPLLVRWGKVLPVFKARGREAALEFIRENMLP